jgi:hypothetical protein
MSLTEGEVKKLVDEIYESTEFREFRTSRTGFDEIRNQQQTIPLPDIYKNAFVPFYHSYEAQHAYNVQMQEMRHAAPVYSMFSRAIESERQKGAQSFEHFMNRQRIIWWENLCYELTGSDQITKGAGMYRLGLRTESVEVEGTKEYRAWADKPAQGEGQDTKAWAKGVDEYKLRKPTPFVLEAVSIMACAVFEDADGVAYVVEKSKRPVNAVLATYGWGVRDGRLCQLGAAVPPDFQMDPKLKYVDFAELCTRDTIYHLIQDPGSRDKNTKYQLVGQYPNPFGAVRYILAPGVVRNEIAFGDKYVPLIEGSLKVAEDRSYFGTLRKFAAACAALPFMDVVTEAEGVMWTDPKTGQPMTIKLDPFKPTEYQLPPGTKLQERYQRVATDMDRFEAIITQDLQRYGPSEVLTGGSAGEREPAWGLALRGEKAEHGIEPVLNGQKKALKEIAREVAWCVKNYLKEDVLIWTVVSDRFGEPQREQIRIRPDDIEEDFDIDMDMGYKNTALELANRESLRRGKIEGDISRRRFQEDGYGVADTIAEDRQIDLETLDKMMRPITLDQAVQAGIFKLREELGLPPATPEQIEQYKIMAFQAAGIAVATPQRAATPVHTTAEAPPTPAGERVL